MEEPNHSAAISTSHSSPADAAASSSTSQVREEAANYDRDSPPRLFPRHNTVSYREDTFPMTNNEASPSIGDDTWSCIIVIVTFWFFVSMTLILGVYGSMNLRLGPYSSMMLKPNPFFVEYVMVEGVGYKDPGPMLYGFYEDPPLDVVNTCSEAHFASLPTNTHKEWSYFLNEGSQINISYSVIAPNSPSLILIIAQGNEGFAQWLEDPSYPNTTLSWNIIHGNGMVQQNISKSSGYYVAVGNLNSEKVKVQLDLKLRVVLYNTTTAYYKCILAHGHCSLKLFFPKRNAAVLTTPGPTLNLLVSFSKILSGFMTAVIVSIVALSFPYFDMRKPNKSCWHTLGTTTDEWYVKLSYGPRWITYLIGIGTMTALVLLVIHFFNNFRRTHEVEPSAQFGEEGSVRAPLLSRKDDDLSSWGSSYDSVSGDGEDLEDAVTNAYPGGKQLKDSENSNNACRLCAICFDAPRDCFFLPCGHCVACFPCGTRIAEASGICPICRKKLKKVRRIYTV